VIRKAQLQLKVGYSSANIQPLANRQYEDENFEPNIAKDTHKPIDENAIRVFSLFQLT
jgi:hypothetical protein